MPSLGITLRIQDSRRFGEEASTTSNQRNLDLFEGYAVIDSFLHPTLSVKAGRMALSCGSDRIIGNLAWNNVGRAFDGVLIHFAHGDALLDAFAVNIADGSLPPDPVNSANTVYKRDNGTVMTGGYYTNPFSDAVLFNAYALSEQNRNRSVPGKNDLERYTLGTHVKGAFGPLIYDAEAALQKGEEKGTTISAWMLAISLGFAPEQSALKSFSANVDVISGTSAASSQMQTFVPPYATGHKFYGIMDYFIVMPVQTFNRGIIDTYVRMVWKSLNGVTTTATLHHFTTQQPFSATDDENGLGEELDIVCSYRYTTHVSFETGVTSFIPNTLLRRSFGSSDISYWGYFTTTIGF